MLLKLEHISKTYDEEAVLRDVSLELDCGQSVAIVAPSGAGKSTLLSIAGLLLEPTEGRVVIDGVDASSLSEEQRCAIRAEHIGFLFQHTQLIGSLRAVDNVTLPADFAHEAGKRLSDAEVESRARERLVAFGLEDRLYHFPSQLSVGQKRRIATARALFLDPKLIIADEPTNDLDEQNAQLVIEALFAPVRQGKAGLLYATHDKALAERADRIVRLGQ